MNITTTLLQATVNIGEVFGSPWGRGVLETSSGPTAQPRTLISLVLVLGLTFAGILLLFFIVFAGIKMIGSAGNNDPKEAAAARSAITYAIAGFLIVALAYIIVRLIEFILGTNFITGV